MVDELANGRDQFGWNEHQTLSLHFQRGLVLSQLLRLGLRIVIGNCVSDTTLVPALGKDLFGDGLRLRVVGFFVVMIVFFCVVVERLLGRCPEGRKP